MCKHKLMTASLLSFSHHPNLFRRSRYKMMHLVAGCVIEGSMVSCQNNTLGHSMRFHGDYINICLLTLWVSQISHLTQLISEIKNIVNCCKQTFFNASSKIMIIGRS